MASACTSRNHLAATGCFSWKLTCMMSWYCCNNAVCQTKQIVKIAISYKTVGPIKVCLLRHGNSFILLYIYPPCLPKILQFSVCYITQNTGLTHYWWNDYELPVMDIFILQNLCRVHIAIAKSWSSLHYYTYHKS